MTMKEEKKLSFFWLKYLKHLSLMVNSWKLFDLFNTAIFFSFKLYTLMALSSSDKLKKNERQIVKKQ